MDATNYTSFRQNLTKFIDSVIDNNKPLLITRQNGEPAILMSVEDFNSYEETSYLLTSPKNAKRLLKSVTKVNEGKTQKHDLATS